MYSKKYPRIPGRRHWQALEEVRFLRLEPDEFLQRWAVTYEELAKICNCSVATVKLWFSLKNRREASDIYKIKLAIVHQIWMKL